MIPDKKTYTKTEISQKLGVQTYIITLWEKQFGIQTTINNGEEHYSDLDAARLNSIKELLYEKGYSITAAKQFLEKFPMAHESGIIAASPLLFESSKTLVATPSQPHNDKLISQLLHLKQQLLKLQEIL